MMKKMFFWLLLVLKTLAVEPGSPSFTLPVDRVTYLAEVAALSRVDWPKNRALMIVCHGHSVPAGYFKTPVVNSLSSYPHLLRVGLAEKYPHAVINVVVTAIGGEDSEKGLQRFERDVMSLHPDVVTIDYGLNDRGMGLQRAESAWRAMIERAKTGGAKVILLTPTPDTAAKWADSSDKLALHAEQIRGLAREYQVALVDSYALFQRHAATGGITETLMSQRNHPNEKGHALVSAALLEWFP
jgi:lysophospholipase L1-like esterase